LVLATAFPFVLLSTKLDSLKSVLPTNCSVECHSRVKVDDVGTRKSIGARYQERHKFNRFSISIPKVSIDSHLSTDLITPFLLLESVCGEIRSHHLNVQFVSSQAEWKLFTHKQMLLSGKVLVSPKDRALKQRRVWRNIRDVYWLWLSVRDIDFFPKNSSNNPEESQNSILRTEKTYRRRSSVWRSSTNDWSCLSH
jgi:hypothetical protein